MVLSNKKLKQKLRTLLAESVEAAESGKPAQDAAAAEGVQQELQSLKELLSSKTHRSSRPTRRGGKRKKSSSLEEPTNAEAGVVNPEDGGEIAAPSDSNKDKKKKKKKERKREGGGEGTTESTGQKQEKEKREEEEERRKNKKKKKKEEEDKEVDVKCRNGDGRIDVGRNGNKTIEPATIATGEENGDTTRRVYVGGIPYYSTEDDIRSFFEGCGTVTKVDCLTFPESGKFRGIAFLTFKTAAAAGRALALDGADMGGFYLKIQPYKAMRTEKSDFSPEVVDGYHRIYAGNLSWDVTEDDLRKLFTECKISSIRFGEDKATGEFKGYAHVDFSDSPSLAAALKLDQTVVSGRPVRIRCAVPKKGAEAKTSTRPESRSVDGDTSSGSARKKKRQTCYQCGLPGHLSSSCPQRKPLGETKPTTKVEGRNVEGDTGSESAKKKKRQTCYQCGVPGHLSSSCPQRKSVEAAS